MASLTTHELERVAVKQAVPASERPAAGARKAQRLAQQFRNFPEAHLLRRLGRSR